MRLSSRVRWRKCLDVGQAKDWIKVSIQQFSGIEINDFAVSVAKQLCGLQKIK